MTKGADPALVASQSSQQAVSTKGFDPGERTKAERLAFTLNWIADNGSCRGLHPAEVRKAAGLLVEQEKELVTLNAALATKDHIVTVEVTEKNYRKTLRATAVIADPRIYYGEIQADAWTLDASGDDWLRHVARNLTAITTRDWVRDLEAKTYAAFRRALARIEAGTDETRNAAQPEGREPDQLQKDHPND